MIGIPQSIFSQNPRFKTVTANDDITAGESVVSSCLELKPVGSNIADLYPNSSIWENSNTGTLMYGNQPLSTSAGGSDGQVQFNDNGAFNGSANMYWNAADNELNVFNMHVTDNDLDTIGFTVDCAALINGARIKRLNNVFGHQATAIKTYFGECLDLFSSHGLGLIINNNDDDPATDPHYFKIRAGSVGTELVSIDTSANMDVNGTLTAENLVTNNQIQISSNQYTTIRRNNLGMLFNDPLGPEIALDKLRPIKTSLFAIPYKNGSANEYTFSDKMTYNGASDRLNLNKLYTSDSSSSSISTAGGIYATGDVSGHDVNVDHQIKLYSNDKTQADSNDIKLLALDNENHYVITATDLASSTSASPLLLASDGSGQLFITTSSRRFKTRIKNAPKGIGDDILKLRPKVYYYKNDITRLKKNAEQAIGFIAEDNYKVNPLFAQTSTVDEVPKGAVIVKKVGDKTRIVNGINIQGIVTGLVDLVKMQNTAIEILQDNVETLLSNQETIQEDYLALLKRVEDME